MLLMIAGVLGGLVTWTFVEYAMHNFNGHKMRGRTKFSREHLRHHAEEGYFAPLYLKVLTGLLVSTIILVSASFAVGWSVGTAFTAGFLAGYVFYETLHFRLHKATPQSRYMRWAARHHFSHHFNCPKHNHGVTSPIWDHVFGTYRKVETVRVPRRLAMSWLVDDLTDDVLKPFQGDFRLTGRVRS